MPVQILIVSFHCQHKSQEDRLKEALRKIKMTLKFLKVRELNCKHSPLAGFRQYGKLSPVQLHDLLAYGES